MPFWGIESTLFVIFVVGYLVARTLAAGEGRNGRPTRG